MPETTANNGGAVDMHTRIAIAKSASLVAGVTLVVPLVLSCWASLFPPPPCRGICDLPPPIGAWILLTGFLALICIVIAALTWAIYLIGGRIPDEKLSGRWTQVLKLDAVLLLVSVLIALIGSFV